jgi:hypothetical protein
MASSLTQHKPVTEVLDGTFLKDFFANLRLTISFLFVEI